MKKLLCVVLCVFMLSAFTAGCSNGKSNFGIAENEIFTYQKLDGDKTALVISRTGNTYINEIAREFEKNNPDIQVICIDITGGNSGVAPVVDWVKNGKAPDIMFYPTGTFGKSDYEEYFENLSAKSYLSSYNTEALNREAIGADIYCLPGPSKIDCMIYNKTLFSRYGWQVPKTFDEFVALCVQIDADTDGEVQAWNPNAKYSNEINVALEAFCYSELFEGVDNRAWYVDFCNGDAKFTGHMEYMYECIQKLADNSILKEEYFSYSATTRGKEFSDGKIAMINFPVTLYDNKDYEYSVFPFPGKSEGDGYVSDTLSCVVSVPKKERDDKQKDAVVRFLEYFSSKEGQYIFIGKSLMVSNVKGVELSNEEYMAPLKEILSAGHMFQRLSFGTNNYYRTRGVSFGDDAKKILMGECTGAECMAEVDNAELKPIESADTVEKIYPAEATEDFTILETSFFIADMYREKAKADIALITHNEAYRGNLMLIFKGGLTADNIITLKPRSFENNSTLIKVTMTGRQLINALNDPLGNDETPDCIYAYSGLKCKVAPWNPLGEKYLSVTLSDGSAIDEAKLYTVAVWDKTVKEEYITEKQEAYEGTFEELMTEALTAKKTIAPAKDGRIELVWD